MIEKLELAVLGFTVFVFIFLLAAYAIFQILIDISKYLFIKIKKHIENTK